MFEITVFRTDTIEIKRADKTDKIYRLWFALDSGLAWIYSSKPVAPGQNVRLELFPQNTQDTKTNWRLGIRVAK